MSSLRHTTEPPPDLREASLDAARSCLLDLGWRRATLTEVARRAGVSRMTIYRSWADMSSLLSDLMTREWSAVVDTATAQADPDADPVDRFVASLLAVVRGLRDNELFVRIVELDPELVLPYLVARRGRSQDLVLERVLPPLRAAQAAGLVRAGDPEVIARGLLLAVHGHVLSAHTMVDDRVRPEDLDAELALLVRASLRPPSRPPSR